MGLSADADPDDIAADGGLLNRLDSIRRQAGVAMGLATSIGEVPASIPKIALLSPGQASPRKGSSPYDISVRAISVGQPHKAVPITIAMALASATRIPETTAYSLCRAFEGNPAEQDDITIAHATGRILVSSTIDGITGRIKEISVYRTARLLMSGEVYVK